MSVPVFANGNILFHSDIQLCLDATGCDAVMSAEGNLYNPGIFADKHPHHTDLALEYLEIVKSLKTQTSLTAVKGHLFKLMRPAMIKEVDLRNRLGASREGLSGYEEIVREMEERMKVCHYPTLPMSHQTCFSEIRRSLLAPDLKT